MGDSVRASSSMQYRATVTACCAAEQIFMDFIKQLSRTGMKNPYENVMMRSTRTSADDAASQGRRKKKNVYT